MRTIQEDQFGVQALAWSPDGRLLALSRSREISLWRVADGASFGTFPIEQTNNWEASHPLGLAFSPDGQLFAAGMTDRTIRVWSVEYREPVQILSAHPADVVSVAFSPDGDTLASASSDGTIALWSTLVWTLEETMNMGESVNMIQFSSDGNVLATAAQGPADQAEFETRASLALWRVAGGTQIQFWETDDLRVSSISILPKGQRLAATMDFTPLGRLHSYLGSRHGCQVSGSRGRFLLQ